MHNFDQRSTSHAAALWLAFAAFAGAGCGSHGGSSGSDAGAGGDLAAPTVDDCTSATAHIDKIVCATNAFLATLTTSEATSVNLAFTDLKDRTEWSNLPGVARPGLMISQFSNSATKPAALAMMAVVLTTAGYSDLDGVMNADDYLGSIQGSTGGGPGGTGDGGTGMIGGTGGGGPPDGGMTGGPGGGMTGAGDAGTTTTAAGYSAGNYTVAIFGTPSATGNWEIMFGGHHMAYNITYLAGVGYPVPNHIGVEPKASFTINGGTYAPLSDESAAMVAMYASLSPTDLATAYLQGQTFADVLVGPVEYQTGSSAAAKAKFPTGANRTGVLVSSLSAAQQALVVTAIEEWVNDFDPALSAQLLADYTSAAAFADTYVAWAGTQSAGVDVDVEGTYMRIDGPRLWIEVACQGGIVIQGKTHFHTIYRDKQYDYGATL